MLGNVGSLPDALVILVKNVCSNSNHLKVDILCLQIYSRRQTRQVLKNCKYKANQCNRDISQKTSCIISMEPEHLIIVS